MLMKQFYTGGTAVAKGLNYQSFVAVFIIIHHYDKNNFSLIIDSQEDLQAIIDDKLCVYMQCKSYELSYGKKFNKILESLLQNKDNSYEEYRYKVICPVFNLEVDSRNLVEGILFNDNVYQASISNINIQNNKEKLTNTYIVTTYLRGESAHQENNKSFLKGELSNLNISDYAKSSIIESLFTEISLRNGSNTEKAKTMKPSFWQPLFNKAKEQKEIIIQCEKLIQKLRQGNKIQDKLETQIYRCTKSTEIDDLMEAHGIHIDYILGTWELQDDYTEMINEMCNQISEYCSSKYLEEYEKFSLIVYIVANKVMQ